MYQSTYDIRQSVVCLHALLSAAALYYTFIHLHGMLYTLCAQIAALSPELAVSVVVDFKADIKSSEAITVAILEQLVLFIRFLSVDATSAIILIMHQLIDIIKNELSVELQLKLLQLGVSEEICRKMQAIDCTDVDTAVKIYTVGLDVLARLVEAAVILPGGVSSLPNSASAFITTTIPIVLSFCIHFENSDKDAFAKAGIAMVRRISGALKTLCFFDVSACSFSAAMRTLLP